MQGLIILSFVLMVYSRPQGYYYNRPQINSGTVVQGIAGYPGFVSNHPVPSYSGNSFSSFSGSSFPGYDYVSNSLSPPPVTYGVGQQSPSTYESYNNNYHHQPLAPKVSKHFYIHSAPEEDEDDYQSQQLNLRRANRVYRVVFINAPTQSSKSTALSLRQAENKEKTVIYVLSKKTDAAEIQSALQATPTEPAKPEVIFIKYKTQAEAAHAQRHIKAQYDSLGGTSEVSDQGIAPVSSVIGALGNGGRSASPVRPLNTYLPSKY